MSDRFESELSSFQDEVWASLQKYSQKLGLGLSGIQPENWILLDNAVDELIKKREQLRWRKWPEEIPEVDGRYLVSMDSKDPIDDGTWLGTCNFHKGQWMGQAWQVDKLLYLPIPELPKESE